MLGNKRNRDASNARVCRIWLGCRKVVVFARVGPARARANKPRNHWAARPTSLWSWRCPRRRDAPSQSAKPEENQNTKPAPTERRNGERKMRGQQRHPCDTSARCPPLALAARTKACVPLFQAVLSWAHSVLGAINNLGSGVDQIWGGFDGAGFDQSWAGVHQLMARYDRIWAGFDQCGVAFAPCCGWVRQFGGWVGGGFDQVWAGFDQSWTGFETCWGKVRPNLDLGVIKFGIPLFVAWLSCASLPCAAAWMAADAFRTQCRTH